MMKTLILIGILGILMLGCVEQSKETQKKDLEQEAFGDDVVLLRLSDISSALAHYEYKSGGTTVNYFAVKGSDGVVRTAFDACEVCHSSRKGYSQVEDSVMCNNCGLKFRIEDLGAKNKGAGCWPAYLSHEIKGQYVVIQKSDLERGVRFFP